MVVVTEEYSENEKLKEHLRLASKKLRESVTRTHKLEDAILAYLNQADKTGTMNPKNLRILREAVTRE